MTHEIDYVIKGDDMQAVVVTLDPNEAVHAEAGAMLYMEDGITMETSTEGGLLKGLKRAIVGESFFITTFEHKGRGRSDVAFAAPYPGKIIPIDLEKEGTYLCQKDAYLCSAWGIDISIALTKKLGSGLFGGEGFILQKLSGDGLAFVHAGGTVLERTLAPGESLRVDTGCLVAFQESVDYDIQFVGGFKNTLFGGEGLFFAVLRGPGKVYLQTLPFSRLADRIVKASGATRGGSKGESRGIAGLGGNILKDLISGD
ncbi:MAG: TIGR00266 family protein [bacterium]|nr:TIGR00266 family protein [bacterium]